MLSNNGNTVHWPLFLNSWLNAKVKYPHRSETHVGDALRPTLLFCHKLDVKVDDIKLGLALA